MRQKPVSNDEIEEIAIKWFLRLKEGLLTKDEKDEFKDWLFVLEHKKAFEEISGTWKVLDEYKPTYIKSKTSINNPSYSRRSFLYIATSVVLFLGVYGLYDYYKLTPVFSRTFISDVKETMEVTLSDGTKVFLDANTKLEVVYYMQKRETKVHYGQVMFSVTSNKEKPFYVNADDVVVTVVGTRFSVRNIEGEIKVAVQEGHVKVENKKKHQIFNLLASDGIIKNNKNFELYQIKVSPEIIGTWRFGRISFENESLENVLKEFARYGEKRLVASPEVANIKITGSFDITHGGNFVTALPDVIPIKYINDGEYLMIYKR